MKKKKKLIIFFVFLFLAVSNLDTVTMLSIRNDDQLDLLGEDL